MAIVKDDLTKRKFQALTIVYIIMEIMYRHVIPFIGNMMLWKQLHKLSGRIKARVDLCRDIDRVSERLYLYRQIPGERIQPFLIVSLIDGWIRTSNRLRFLNRLSKTEVARASFRAIKIKLNNDLVADLNWQTVEVRWDDIITIMSELERKKWSMMSRRLTLKSGLTKEQAILSGKCSRR